MLINLHFLQLLPIVGVKSAGILAAGRAAMVKSIHTNQKHDNLYHSPSFHDSINNESMIINPICCPLKWTYQMQWKYFSVHYHTVGLILVQLLFYINLFSIIEFVVYVTKELCDYVYQTLFINITLTSRLFEINK